jgi:hypothetical protein
MKQLLLVALLSVSAPALAQAPAAPVSVLPGDAALIQHCQGLLSMEQTYALARHWVDSWNSTSADTVMALYTPDFEFRARGILTSLRIANPSGVLHGQADNRLRWFDPAAKGVKGAGNFRLIDAYAGVRSVAVHYLNGRSEPVVEVMEYAPDCKIERSNAMYGPLPIGNPPPAPPPISAAK